MTRPITAKAPRSPRLNRVLGQLLEAAGGAPVESANLVEGKGERVGPAEGAETRGCRAKSRSTTFVGCGADGGRAVIHMLFRLGCALVCWRLLKSLS